MNRAPFAVVICPKCGDHTKRYTTHVFGQAVHFIACIDWNCGWAKRVEDTRPDPLIFGNAITPPRNP